MASRREEDLYPRSAVALGGRKQRRRTVLQHEGSSLLDNIGDAPLHDGLLRVLEGDEHGDADELGGHGCWRSGGSCDAPSQLGI